MIFYAMILVFNQTGSSKLVMVLLAKKTSEHPENNYRSQLQ
jgi:hypothetical protein